MHLVAFEFTKPTDDSAFEDMCARVYGEVFGDPLPKINGRRGQAQSGVDVFVTASGVRYGIQCKRYADGALKFRHVESEVNEADKKKARIGRLIIATTATADARLIEQVHELSDTRVAQGKFPVEVEFWEDICRHIQSRPRLLNDYAPNAPGAAFHRQEARSLEILAAVSHVSSQVEDIAAALPTARSDSINKWVSAQLDRVNTLLKAARYEDAREALELLGVDQGNFDAHQKARWYLQRGVCSWHQRSGESAVADFLKAYELYPGDEKMAAARVRGLLLSGQVPQAVAEGRVCVERFPTSVQVWLAFTNARLLDGASVGMRDVPESFKTEADVLQLVAWGRFRANDFRDAVEISQKSLALPEAGFYVRLAALTIVVQAMSSDVVAATQGAHPEHYRQALDSAVLSLEPWTERVFAVQAAPGLEEAVVMLMYGYLLKANGEEALTLASEAKARGVVSSRLVRAELDVLRELGRKADLIEFATGHLSELDEDGLVLLGEAAANEGRIADVQIAAAAYPQRFPEGTRADTFRALGWLAAWRSPSGDKAAVLSEIRAVNLSETSSFPLLQAGARILHEAAAGDIQDDEQIASRVEMIVPLGADPAERMSAADLLFDIGRYSQAARYYASLFTGRPMSGIHARLLECYVRAGERRKAKSVLESLPDGWVANDRARGAAMELGQDAGDWGFLEPIAQVQRSRYPRQASSWLFNLLVLLRARKMLAFHQLLTQVPLELDATAAQAAQLAGLEIRYGHAEAGMRRIYAAYRRRLDEVSAAEAFFISLIGASEPLPNMEDELPYVVPGVSVTLRDQGGGTFTVTLDPPATGNLPTQGEFHASASAAVAALLGRALGETVTLPGGMAGPRSVTVMAITSAYRRLLAVAQETFSRSLEAPKHLMHVAISHSEQGADFSQMHSMLKEQSAHAQRAFDAYAESPITLGLLGKLLGRNAIDFVTSWPLDAAPLYVCQGRREDFEEAHSLLKSEATLVVDAATLAEFVALRVESVLAHLSVLITTDSLQVVEARLEEAKTDRAAGRAVDMDGTQGYIEFTDRQKAARVEFLERVLAAAQAYCVTCPAYGPDPIPDEFRRLATLLPREENAALLLAAERGAVLLTLDGRLADLARTFLGLSRVWPQPVLALALEKGWLPADQVSVAFARSFVANRAFISMRGGDLLMMCLQGTFMLRRGIELLKRQLSSPNTVFPVIANVCVEFLAGLASIPLSVRAYAEIVSHVCEAACRHPEAAAANFVPMLQEQLDMLLADSEVMEAYPPLLEQRRRIIEMKARHMEATLLEAQRLARSPALPRPVRLEVLMCAPVPRIVPSNESAEPAPTADETPPTCAGGQGKSGGNLIHTSATSFDSSSGDR